MWITLLVSAGVVAALAVRHQSTRARRAVPPPAWALARDQLGGALEAQPLRLRCELDGVEVQVSVEGERAGWTVFTTQAATLPAGVRFVGPSKGERPTAVEVQDPSFDGNVFAEGDETVVLALCDSRFRRRLERLGWSYGFELAEGRIVARMAGRASSTAVILQTIKELVSLAGSTDLEARGVADRLAGHVKADPVAAVRRRAFNLLHQHFTGSTALDEARAAALGDGDAGLRLMAAETLPPDEALPHLRALLEDPVAAAEVRTAALERLRADQSTEEVALALDAAFTTRPDAYAGAVLEMCAALEHRPAASLLAAWAGGVGDEDAPALAAALAHADDDPATAEAALLTLLARDDNATRAAAAEALTAVGAHAAITALRALAVNRLEPAELRSACRRTADAITARLGD